MAATPAVRNLIRESKAHQLDNVIASSSAEGMVSMDQSILRLFQAGRVSRTEAMRHCISPEWMERRLGQL